MFVSCNMPLFKLNSFKKNNSNQEPAEAIQENTTADDTKREKIHAFNSIISILVQIQPLGPLFQDNEMLNKNPPNLAEHTQLRLSNAFALLAIASTDVVAWTHSSSWPGCKIRLCKARRTTLRLLRRHGMLVPVWIPDQLYQGSGTGSPGTKLPGYLPQIPHMMLWLLWIAHQATTKVPVLSKQPPLGHMQTAL